VTGPDGALPPEDSGDPAATQRQPTIKTIAASAGVGVGTVSRVLSGRGYVSPDTRSKVEAAVRNLRYRPSAIGRGLKEQRTKNIGLLVADVSNSYYGDFAKGVLAEARHLERHVVVGSSDDDPVAEREYIELFLEQRVEGIIAFPSQENLAAWREAQEMGINLVFADRVLEELDVPFVVVDNHDGAYALTEYLIALGHRRIGYLGGPRETTSGREREQGYRDAHLDAGVEVEEELVVPSHFTRRNAFANALRILGTDRLPTALVASNNILGEAALGAVRHLDLSIPDDISLVMFDDVPWATLVSPPITVVTQPARRLGREAARLVVRGAPGASSVLVRTELVVRSSAAPPRAGG
jgi:LacI family transcriptional regulator